MRKLLLLTSAVLAICFTSFFSGCKKETVSDPKDVLAKSYRTGVIKFSFSVPFFHNGNTMTKDTTVAFTSTGSNPSETDDYGYNQPSIPWAQILRLNPKDYQNSTGIFFTGTDLNTLTLPYKFQPGDTKYAFINYTLGYRPFIDSSGNLTHIGNTYLGTTWANDFELTILSKDNNRLLGAFSGSAKNRDGDIINIKDGLFDIQIVDK